MGLYNKRERESYWGNKNFRIFWDQRYIFIKAPLPLYNIDGRGTITVFYLFTKCRTPWLHIQKAIPHKHLNIYIFAAKSIRNAYVFTSRICLNVWYILDCRLYKMTISCICSNYEICAAFSTLYYIYSAVRCVNSLNLIIVSLDFLPVRIKSCTV